jgi:RNA polymerase sigma-70 factor (ECF subfamily)
VAAVTAAPLRQRKIPTKLRVYGKVRPLRAFLPDLLRPRELYAAGDEEKLATSSVSRPKLMLFQVLSSFGRSRAGEAPERGSTLRNASDAAAPPVTPKRRPFLRAITGGATPSQAPAYTDTELFEGIATGDERIARELYRRLLPAVEAALYRVLGRREHDHEDLIQSSFEQIILTLAQRRYAQACSLNTWASTIAAHVALKSLRSRYRQRNVFDARVGADELLELTSSGQDVERTVGDRRELERLRLRLSELPAAQAEAVVLHDLMGHPLAEIAAITGASVAAAQSRLVRGRKELMARMAADQKDTGDFDGGA